MARFRILQVSDTHLSRHKAYFQDNWEAFLQIVAADPPDLLVCSGDACFDGPSEPDDVAFAREQLHRLPVPWAVIPGNHDVGDQPPDEKLHMPITVERRAPWLEHFGSDYWVRELGGWRIFGLNSQLFDSGLAAAGEQAAWFEQALAQGAGAPVALFLHKPLFLLDPEGSAQSPSHSHPGTRSWLLPLCKAHGVRLIASGHLHRYHTFDHDGIAYVWCPATAFLGNVKSGLLLDQRSLGYAEHVFDGSRVQSRIVLPPEFTQHDMAAIFREQGSTVHLPPKPLAG